MIRIQAPVTVQARYDNIDNRSGIIISSAHDALHRGPVLGNAASHNGNSGQDQPIAMGADFDWLSTLDFDLPADGSLNPELFEFLGCHFPADDMGFGFMNGI